MENIEEAKVNYCMKFFFKRLRRLGVRRLNMMINQIKSKENKSLRERRPSYIIVYQLYMSTTVGNRWQPFLRQIQNPTY